MQHASSWTRRSFLKTTGAAAALTALGAKFGNAAPTPPALPVIDTHIHLYDPARPGGIPWPPDRDTLLYSPHLPARFQALTEKLGVVGVIVVEANAEPADNQWVLDLAKDNPLIVGYIGRLLPDDPDFAARFDRYAENPIFRGLRFTQPMLAAGWEQPSLAAHLQRLAERRLTLDLVGGPSVIPCVSRIEKIAPGLCMVIDHLPFKEWDTDSSAMRTALSEAAQLPNVYAKISNVARQSDGQLIRNPDAYRPGLDALWELFGEDRVLYGSNWPVSDHTAPYDEIFHILADYLRKKPHSVAEKYFWKNSVAAYHWQPRGLAAGLS